MALPFVNLDRPSIRRLKPSERITEHGITAESLRDGDLRFPSTSWSTESAFTGLSEKRATALSARSARTSSKGSAPKRSLTASRCRKAGNSH